MSGSGTGVGTTSGSGTVYAPFYSSVEDVLALSGVRPVDFDLEDD
jgi:hypothetical protein